MAAVLLTIPAHATATDDSPRSSSTGSLPLTYKRVGYLPQWATDRGFSARNLVLSGAAARLTHLNYAFANVSRDGQCVVGDPVADYQRTFSAEESVDGIADAPDQALKGNLNQLRKLKKMYPNLKLQISLGGWEWSKYFSDAVLTRDSRRKFVSSCLDLFIKKQHEGGSCCAVFDGIDIDWEFPGSSGKPGNVVGPGDKVNFTHLLGEFRKQLDDYGRRVGRRFGLTAFLPADQRAIRAGYDGKRIFRYLDFGTVQGYDFNGAWTLPLVTDQQSALYQPAGSGTSLNADLAIQSWLSHGARRLKLVLGVPFYGRGWTGVSNMNHGLHQSATAAAPGPDGEPGHGLYRRLRPLIRSGFRVHRDDNAGMAWLFDGNTYWTFDDPRVMRLKTRYIRQQCLGGAMMWSLDGDDAQSTLVATLSRGLRTRSEHCRELDARATFTYDYGAVIRGDRSRREIALVFTGGAYGDGTRHILDTLKRLDVKAGMFVTGEFLRPPSHRALLRRVEREGHYLGPHSHAHLQYAGWTDRDKTCVTKQQFREDLARNLDELGVFRRFDEKPVLFIPPSEWYNKDQVEWAREMGVLLLGITPDGGSYRDWIPEGEKGFVPSREILGDILTYEKSDPDGLNGSILLMHLGASRVDKMYRLLAELVTRLRKRSYTFVRIDEMLRGAR